MPSTAISAEQREAYDRDGFIIYKNFLGDAELEEWRAALDNAVDDRGPLDHEADGALKIPQWWPDSPPEEQESTIGRRTAPDRGQHKNPNPHYSRVFTQRVNLWMTSPSMREKMLDPELGKMVAELTGEEGVRIWVSAAMSAAMPPPRRSLTDALLPQHDQTLIKEPWGNPTAMHVDNPCGAIAVSLSNPRSSSRRVLAGTGATTAAAPSRSGWPSTTPPNPTDVRLSSSFAACSTFSQASAKTPQAGCWL